MTKQRIPETDHGIQGEVTVTQYDLMQRGFRDRGWLETKAVLSSGITSGNVLEVGHGPGYLGLEWLKQTQNTSLTGLDISADMNTLAQRNAREYGLSNRTDYRLGNSSQLPFPSDIFEAVFTSGSLHEWAEPQSAFEEIWRVLKPGGRYFISDLRRDMSFPLLTLLWLSVRPTSIRPGLLTSISAAYTVEELTALLGKTHLKEAKISANAIDLAIVGAK
ncbi:MAG: class I SAM-dependent methyltransferase [Anaerolineaceae bacterium]|nr:class I SAM-dependent methyltransferase [Anaerolineaceae bacterium]